MFLSSRLACKSAGVHLDNGPIESLTQDRNSGAQTIGYGDLISSTAGGFCLFIF